MNIFDKFMISREVTLEDGKITLDRQRVMVLPISFMGLLSIRIKDHPEQVRNLYRFIKSGMPVFAMPIGKEYQLAYNSFLDRWVKYTAFAGWGTTEYQLVEKGFGFLHIKNSPLHMYLKSKGIKEPIDVIEGALIAGSLSSTFNVDVDVVETECVCSGYDHCTYYWGSKAYLREKFPAIALRQFGDVE